MRDLTRPVVVAVAATVGVPLVMAVAPILNALQAPSWLRDAWDAGTFITGLTLVAIGYYATVSWLDLQRDRRRDERGARDFAHQLLTLILPAKSMGRGIRSFRDLLNEQAEDHSTDWVGLHLEDFSHQLEQLLERIRDNESLGARYGVEQPQTFVELDAARLQLLLARNGIRSAVHEINAADSISAASVDDLREYLEAAAAHTNAAETHLAGASKHLPSDWLPDGYVDGLIEALTDDFKDTLDVYEDLGEQGLPDDLTSLQDGGISAELRDLTDG